MLAVTVFGATHYAYMFPTAEHDLVVQYQHAFLIDKLDVRAQQLIPKA